MLRPDQEFWAVCRQTFLHRVREESPVIRSRTFELGLPFSLPVFRARCVISEVASDRTAFNSDAPCGDGYVES
jgi:hypothetical protein